MLRNFFFAGSLLCSTAATMGQDLPQSHQAPPPVIQQCDHVAGNTNCGTWTSDGAGGYSGRWDHGEAGHIAVGSFDGRTVQFLRQDAAGKKLLATYTGRVAGNEIVDGVIAWKILGHEFKWSWTGKLIYPPEDPATRPENAPAAATTRAGEAPSKAPAFSGTPVPNFLLGKWGAAERPVVEEPCRKTPGMPDICEAMRVMRANAEAQRKATTPEPRNFTATELTVSGPPGGVTGHYPVTYAVNTPKSVTVTPLNKGKAGQSFECRLLGTGELYGPNAPAPLTGAVRVK